MKPGKPINGWSNVFLDTSVIIDYVTPPSQYEKNPPVKERVELVHKLMDIIDAPTADSRARRLYISSITVGELKHLASPQTTRDIVQVFRSGEVIFVDFTKDMALSMNNSLVSGLSRDELTKWLAHITTCKLTDQQYLNARHWIQDDMKIVSCAKSIRSLDVILTSDHKTFKPIADRFEVPCLTMKKEEFPHDIFGELDPAGVF